MSAREACLRRRKPTKRMRSQIRFFALVSLFATSIILFSTALSRPQRGSRLSKSQVFHLFYSPTDGSARKFSAWETGVYVFLIGTPCIFAIRVIGQHVGNRIIISAVYGFRLFAECFGMMGSLLWVKSTFTSSFPQTHGLAYVAAAVYICLQVCYISYRTRILTSSMSRAIVGLGRFVYVALGIPPIVTLFFHSMGPHTLTRIVTPDILATMVAMLSYSVYETRKEIRDEDNFSLLVYRIRRAADARHYSFYHEAERLLILKQIIYSQSGIQVECEAQGNDLLNDWKLKCFALGDKKSIELSRVFFALLKDDASEQGLIGNSYRRAAIVQFEPSIRSVIKRGLSSVLPCDDLQQAAHILLSDIQNRGVDRKIPDERDVMYIAVSYRYESAEGLSPRKWKAVLKLIAATVKRLGYDRMRLWIDRIAVTRGMVWSNVGFLPYLVFPTFVHPNARRFTNRIWLELEKLAATLGPGILDEETSEDDYMQHLVMSRSPNESILAFAEVLVSNSLRAYEVTYEQDREEMRAWARSVLTTDDVTQVLTTPRYDLEGRGEVRHDVSMLCLYDDDVKRCDAVKAYIGDISKQQSEQPQGYGRSPGSRWDGIVQLCGGNAIRNSEEVGSILEDHAVVLASPRSRLYPALCWYVLETMRGTIVTKVLVTHRGDVRTGEVQLCIPDSCLSRLSLACSVDRIFRIMHQNMPENENVLVNVTRMPYRDIKWTWGEMIEDRPSWFS